MAKKETRLPALTTLDSIKEALDVRLGRRGDPLDRAITMRDLVDSGLPVNAVRRPGGNGVALEYEQPVGRIVPPVPFNFIAQSQFGGIHVLWDKANQHSDIAYAEIYRGTTNSVAARQYLTIVSGTGYFDVINAQNYTLYYYWVRFVSVTGHSGPFAGPVSAMVIPLVSDVIARMAEELADEPSDLGSSEETLILHAKRFAIRQGSEELVYPLTIDEQGRTVIDTALIREGAIQQGQLGAITIGKINRNDGTPITTAAGLLRADAIDADNLSVKEAATFYGDAQSGNFSPGVSGWIIKQDGYVEFNDAVIRGNVDLTTLSVNGQSPTSGFALNTGGYNWSSGYRSGGANTTLINQSKTITATVTLLEVPAGSRITVDLFRIGQAEVFVNAVETTGSPPSSGDPPSPGTTSTAYYNGSGAAQFRFRMYVDNNLSYEVDHNLSNSGLGGVNLTTPEMGTITRTHTYNEYRSSSIIKIEIYMRSYGRIGGFVSQSTSSGYSGTSPCSASGSFSAADQQGSGNLSRI